jgi:hypothetical protein
VTPGRRSSACSRAQSGCGRGLSCTANGGLNSRIERPINGKTAEERRVVRQELSKPLVEELASYMREQRSKLSRGHDLAKAIDYILKRWAAFTLFLDDGRVCLSNNAAERALRGIALGRKSWLFCGSDRGGERERRRSSGLAGRHPVPDRHVSGTSAQRHVHTIARVAEMLGEHQDWLWDVANEMDQEDGLIWVYGPGEDAVMAFTDFGIETLTGLIENYRADPDLLKRSSEPK